MTAALKTVTGWGLALALASSLAAAPVPTARYDGEYFRGAGDTEYLRLLDIARRMFAPDARYQNLSMLYEPRWNGFVEGPTWDAWWIQNSYGTTYAALPFFQEPYTTFIRNSQDLWWDQMGDGKRIGSPPPHEWIAPDGQLCDAARPGYIIYKQGDGKLKLHDWGFEFTAAGMVLQSEFLLIGRDPAAIAKYVPKLERSANLIWSRRDPANDLFRVGPAANLMAPSYAGYKRPDGTYGEAYLAGLSVTYIAALDRLIELEKMAGAADKVKLYTERREAARRGLPRLMSAEGYFVKYIDPDGTKHGVYGAPKHGYFEAAPNHDAIAFRVVDDAQSTKILDKMDSIPGLRPYGLIITNYPSLDDMYMEPEGLWRFGNWVNGGHWSTCEARMMLGYYRMGKYGEARKSMERILGFAERFRMDNNLTNFGSDVYQPKVPVNLTYDAFAIPAALVRGLFEYLYRADGLTILPHIPPGVTALEQLFPVRFGPRRVYLSVYGSGPVTGVLVNGRPWRGFDAKSVTLAPDAVPDEGRVQILLGGAKPASHPRKVPAIQRASGAAAANPALAALQMRADQAAAFREELVRRGLGGSYEAAHAQLAIDAVRVARERFALVAAGTAQALPEASQTAASQSYIDTANRLFDGLERVRERQRK
jgi:hypothetical protein